MVIVFSSVFYIKEGIKLIENGRVTKSNLMFGNCILAIFFILVELKEVVWSKISHGYVEVDSLGGTLLFTLTKSDKN